MKKLFTKHSLILALLMLVAISCIVAVLPRTDREHLSYEEGLPWKYRLLTAPFDIPVYLDSATMWRLTDSVKQNFHPYVEISTEPADQLIEGLRALPGLSTDNYRVIRAAIEKVYNKGVIDNNVKQRLAKAGKNKAVNVVTGSSSNTAREIDATEMLTPTRALDSIIADYESARALRSFAFLNDVSDNVWDYLKTNLRANITMNDSVDATQLRYALAAISSAQGTIRQGQRIVDRGEVVTPQIYRNLQEYESLLDKTNSVDDNNLGLLAGQIAYLLVVLSVLYIYLAKFHARVFADIRIMTFLMSCLVVFAVIAILLGETIHSGIYIAPFAAVPVVILLFVDRRVAVIGLLASVMIGAMAAIYQFQFIFMELVAGITAIFCLKQLSRRSQLLRVSLFSFLAYMVTYAISLLLSEGSFGGISLRVPVFLAVNAVLLALTYVLIFVIERIFGFTSTVTLVELNDINHPLLRRLSEEAPGTFQHSMQVATLAADAARAIGANTQLVRTGALYHDIGKLSSPIFFTENQHGVNPHNGLDPKVSAKKIISHVTEGLALAQKHKLPKVVRDFIAEHHGKGVTRYFYNTVCNAHPDETIDPTPFTYPGPNPRSKETAILMMADSVEAASRSLQQYSAETIGKLVDKIIDTQMQEGLLKDSPISFSDIEHIKETFKDRLGTIYHSRVAYPDRK